MSSNIKSKCASLVADCEENGFTTIRAGVFLQTGQNLSSDQASWDDEDPSKNIDFSKSAYWITTDNGNDPDSIDSLEEFYEYVMKAELIEDED